MLTIDKPWGKEEILTVQDKYVIKRLHIAKGKRCSLQYHRYKTETIYILSGALLLYLDKQVIIMLPGDFHTIVPGEVHRMEGQENSVYLESSTTELNDVIRMEDDYGRK